MPAGWVGGAASTKPGYSLKLLLEYKVELEKERSERDNIPI